MLNYNTMMSAVLIKYWLRYKKKKRRKKERQKDLLRTSAVPQYRFEKNHGCDVLFFSGSRTIQIFTGSIKAPCTHMRAQEGAHMRAHTPTLTHTRADTTQAKGKPFFPPTLLGPTLKRTYLTTFFELKCKWRWQNIAHPLPAAGNGVYK